MAIGPLTIETHLTHADTCSSTPTISQALGFYQKLGYEVFTVLEDHLRNHRNYHLRKRLE
jgi:hypothetical protein